MLKALNHRNPTPMVVDLKDNILVSTTIPQEQHPALRAGFAGYPVNPRWNVNKYHAWKMGCQLRNDLREGKLIVRSSDSMLVPQSEDHYSSISERSKGQNRLISIWNKHILKAIPIA